jgi:light-regulated signal transduction histidine kinase (bacteriophytochrome)
LGYSLLLEDCSSVKKIVVQNSAERTGAHTFFSVEIMYLLWKLPPPVHIEQIVADRTNYSAADQISPGIPPAIRGSVFQSPVSYGKPEGSGLGLAIAKTLVEDHGGTIRLDERCEWGTSFIITIPFAIPGKHDA